MTWRIHNLVPLYKRNFVADPSNYRGIHITSILSKVAEHVIGAPLLNYFEKHNCFGKQQWAYRKSRSSRDLVTLLVCSWLFAFMRDRCIGAFFGDISGAFDRVFKPFLLQRLASLGVGEPYLQFLSSFLSRRFGYVCVNGEKSHAMTLEDQVFQGTVLGPPLWNIFFSTIVQAFVDPSCAKAFADDLNLFHEYSRHEDGDVILHDLHNSQTRTHAWGKKYRVEFDPAKESFNILHPHRGEGRDFKL